MEHIKREHPGKHQAIGARHYVPYTQTTQQQAGTQANQGTTAQQNTYTPGQTGLQGQLGSLYQSLLGGNIPSSFTNPQAAINAYNTNFQQSVAPGLAAQYGAGSPQIGSQNALGLAQLQGNLYNQGVQNYMGALGQGSNYAFNATGATGANTNMGANTMQGTSTTNMNPLGFLLSALLGGG